ncbi:hypothetical protein CLOM621_07889 [Clostridium sp. M62/1]|nr:hypothetical protein CLOM621_07889 [Clostridium sp. M62/1]
MLQSGAEGNDKEIESGGLDKWQVRAGNDRRHQKVQDRERKTAEGGRDRPAGKALQKQIERQERKQEGAEPEALPPKQTQEPGGQAAERERSRNRRKTVLL